MKKIVLLSLTGLFGLAMLGGSANVFADEATKLKENAMAAYDNKLKQLDLTPAQQAKIDKVEAEAKVDENKANQKMTKTDKAIKDLTGTPNYSQSKLKKLEAEKAALTKKLNAVQTKKVKKINSVLTPAQKQQISTETKHYADKAQQLQADIKDLGE